jgi:hypothetical protein
MPSDPLWRLRLKYEDSRGKCHICGVLGIVGHDLKLTTDFEKLSTEGLENDSFVLRCTDPLRCGRPKLGER